MFEELLDLTSTFTSIFRKIAKNKKISLSQGFILLLINSQGSPMSLLADQIGLDNIEDLIKKRKEFYSLADYKIECRKLTINQISDKIIEFYENSQN